ncbi:putative zinc-binding metallopeptidase [Pedobacter sp. ISL-68]|uniref:zinc-binding metallopeptidase n=1 Tax=unclassified Pedobacter TaxID=2628915 RepID=UPI001BE6989C|nr:MULTISPECIES: putative zinc-binding metallopeptidase [unclassified Pedobacter]MBT2561874.1 putative zinc-binding metallopeptidase [Pedobacter sp. ISL-64]MBT2592532.1 putative zinc-binding metallopeptidase [Pedobacter sp. ISL-68]
MKKKLLLSIVALATIFLAGCSKKDDLSANLVGLGGDTWTKGPIDEWISTNYTTPYNIEVKYKWDRSELGEIYKNVVPVKEELVVPIMDIIKKTWIDPYVAVKGANFMKTYTQKQFYLAGSPSYNSNGTITLGTAEAGRKIVLLDLNTFNPANKPAVKQILHTMHHEFGHILNQNIAVTPDYQRITPSDYTATWFNIFRGAYSSTAALDKILYENDFWGKGFVTPYSRSNKDDDFVETLSTLLEGGAANFDNIINNLFIYDGLYIKRNGKGVYEQNTDARSKLLRKKAIVISYMKDSWGIDLTDLQNKTQAAIEAQSPTADFNSLLGPGKTYGTITINPQKLTGLSAKFLTAYNTANTTLQAGNPQTNKGYYIDNISLIFTTANKVTLRVNFMDPTAALGVGFNGDFDYNINNVNGTITMTYANPQPTTVTYGNARVIETYIPTLLAYFNNQQFNIRWVDDITPQSKSILGGLVKTTDPTSYLFGTL